ncbi:hypothetical protein DSC45_34240 [Streptomyces sp. YIM 130001]|uniref:OB-fold nucleic acid binding domain-containing protein n=1 Tax=Streptomyces sp. YIM 130001 TaxID=2259644 RepID=UPI000E64C20B|nr:OB-fold nucleic acid binding domain-containing protein [Streptomyces sp. YIM 130001]RII07977.1 hypothetical protein DSC45_34240 [Streptomyces sp. YIM 130001]
MDRARIKDGQRPVSAKQIDSEPVWYTNKHELICSTCDAAVHGTGTYVKRNGASYRAHFALNPNARHAQSCPLNPIAVITSIAQGAQGLAQVDDGVLKLTLPSDVKALAPGPVDMQPQLPPPGVTAQQIDTVPPPLPPLLNCAAKIARFLQLNAFDDKLVAKFKVQPHGRKSTIPWGRFCYGPTAASYGALMERLVSTGAKTAPLSHPVAVYGTVQRVRRDRSDRPFVYLADHTDLDGKEFEVVLRSMHPSLIEPLTTGTHVLAIGTWKIFPGSRTPQLRLFAKEAWQIAYWHTDDHIGTATQPTSPPALTDHQRATERSTPTPARRTPSPAMAPGQRRTTPRPRRTPPPAAPHKSAPPATRPSTGANSAGDLQSARAAEQDPQVPPAPAAPEAPPQPVRPPQPTSPPPVPPRRRRRTGLAGWLKRRRDRRS